MAYAIDYEAAARTAGNAFGVSTTSTSGTSKPKDKEVEKVKDKDSIFNDVGEGNICTDGKDDGKIGFFSSVGNFFQGIGKTVTGMVKGMFTNKEGKFSIGKTLMSVATIAACFIPVVGPVISYGLAAFGLAKAVGQVAKGAIAASQATNDADAKAAWENMGSGVFTGVASAYGMKASAGVLKAQLKAPNPFSSLKAAKAANGGKYNTEMLGKFKSDMWAGWKSNAGGAAKAVKDKVGDGLKKAGDGIKKINAESIKSAPGKVVKAIADKADDIKTTRATRTTEPKLSTAQKNAIKHAELYDVPDGQYYSNGVPKKATFRNAAGQDVTRHYRPNGSYVDKIKTDGLFGLSRNTKTGTYNAATSTRTVIDGKATTYFTDGGYFTTSNPILKSTLNSQTQGITGRIATNTYIPDWLGSEAAYALNCLNNGDEIGEWIFG